RGQQVHTELMRRLPRPVRVAILETPAGFQPNVTVISSKLRAFFEQHLRNFQPAVSVVAARQRGGIFDPDSTEVIRPLLDAHYIFAGPGSPTYMARHLEGTRTLELLLCRNAEGATLSFASAAAISVGRFVLPVYEIYKVGDDLHWLPGLDLFAPLGLNLTVLPHWNNNEGGSELDTSHCFMGVERFRYLRRLLPAETTMLAIDEHTACILEPDEQSVRVMGAGTVNVISSTGETSFADGDYFGFELLRP
ncbi:MAG TPA: cysteinyl-tRNA synthetase, partial [Nitrolancea sp.]|nr:cysteinyl-tRNA synthetase [Nitrolancea sp.]